MYKVLRLTMPLIFTSLWLVGPTEVKAQQRTKDAFIKMSTREKADRILSVFERHLSLSGIQLTSVKEITLQFATRIDQVWHSNMGKYNQFKQLNTEVEEIETQLKKILSPGQFSVYASVRDEWIRQIKKRK